jgi:phytoene dehydrogenase-like protein
MELTHEDRYDVVVAGAGLAGLAAAAVASGGSEAAAVASGIEPRPRVALVDTRSPGGRARTHQRDGFALNEGAHALYREGEGRRVLGRLGIVPTGGPPALAGASGRRGGELVPLPTTAGQLMRSPILGLRAKARLASLLARLPRLDAAALAGVSAADWLDGLALPDDARQFVETLMRVATYCADFSSCSADAAVGQLQMAVADGVDYLDHGWQQLVDALLRVADERGVDRRPAGRVESLRPDGAGWIVETASGQLRAGAVVLAVGSPAATEALLPRAPGWSIGPDVTAACLDLGLRRAPTPPIVFGMDQPLYLSTHCPPATLAPAGSAVVHVMRYGATAPDADAAELWAHASTAGISEADVVTRRFLSHMVVSHGLPQPGSGLAGRPRVDASGAPGLFLAGDWVGPVGVLADASLASGEQAGQAAAAHAAGIPRVAAA